MSRPILLVGQQFAIGDATIRSVLRKSIRLRRPWSCRAAGSSGADQALLIRPEQRSGRGYAAIGFPTPPLANGWNGPMCVPRSCRFPLATLPILWSARGPTRRCISRHVGAEPAHLLTEPTGSASAKPAPKKAGWSTLSSKLVESRSGGRRRRHPEPYYETSVVDQAKRRFDLRNPPTYRLFFVILPAA